MALDLSNLTPQEQLAAIYIGYYDRAADPVGQSFWVNVVANPDFSLAEIATDFAGQAETLSAYPFLDSPTAEEAEGFIAEVFLNLFNRAPDQAGLDFWSDALIGAINGTNDLTVGEIILSIIGGAQDSDDGNDRTTILNKIEAAIAWTDAAEIAGIDYTSDSAAQASAKSIIEGVTSDDATVDAAAASADSFFGTSLTLTADDQVGEGEANTFTAALATAAAHDVTVTFQLVAGNAAAQDQGTTTTNLNDFNVGAFNPVSVIIPAGASSATFSVTALADDLTELPEGYSVVATAGYTSVTGAVTVLDGDSKIFTLTTGIDSFTGTSGDDTFVGTVRDDTSSNPSTFDNSGADRIDGGAGYDTLEIYQSYENNDVYVVNARSIEELRYQTTDEDEIYLNGMTDIEKITVFQSDDTGNDFYNVQNTVDVAFENNIGNTDARIEVKDSAALADTEVAVLYANNGDASIDLDMDNVSGNDFVTAYTINVTGDNEGGDFDLDDTTTVTTVTVTGDGNFFDLDIDDEDALATIDASAFTGDLTLDSMVADVDLTVTTGAGDDTVSSLTNAAGTTTVAASLSVNAGDGDNDVTLVSGANLQTLTATTGAGDDIVSVDASNASTDGSTVTIGSGDGADEVTYTSNANVALTADLGAGDDVFNIGAGTLYDGDSVDGGAGDADVLSVSASIAVTTTDYSDNIAGFETLAITGALNGTVDVDNFDGIQSVDVQAALGGDSTITGLATGATVTYSADANMGSVLSIEMTDATDPNTPNDTLNVELNADLDGADNPDNNSANLSVDGINVLNVSATDSDNKDEATDQADGYTLNLSNEENVDAINISGDRAVSYTASAEATELNSVDGSAAEGDLNIDLARFSGTEGIELTAGAGDDDLIGTGLSDIVVGGDGDDNITGDAPTTIVSAGVPQVSTFTIANAEAGDVFSIGSTDVTWTGVEGTDNAAVSLALASEITGEQSITVDGNAVATGGTWTVTGAADGSAFANPDLDTTNLPAAGDALTITLTGATFGTGELINYTVNGGSIVSVDVGGLSLAAATTAVVTSLNNQLGLTATSTTAGTISVVGPAGAGNNVTIDMMVADDATDNPASAAADQEVNPETAAVAEVWTITPTDLEATETLSLLIGATSYSVVFDTDLATTLGNFVSTHQTLINAQTGGTLAATANTLTITNAAGGDLTGGTITGTIIGGDGGTATVVETDGTPEVPGINNAAEVISDPADESANAGIDNQTLTVSTTAGTLEVTAGGQTSDELTGGAGSDTFNFASGDSTDTAMDVITDFETGDATIDFDTLNLTSTDVLADVLLANQIDVSQNSEDATPATDIGAIVQDGIITVVGADAAEIDTLDEWGDVVLQVLTAQGGNQVAAFEFEGSTYVVEENANVIELADTVGIVGISTTEDTDVIHIM